MLECRRTYTLEYESPAGVLSRLGVDHEGVVYVAGAVAHRAYQLAAEIICREGLAQQFFSL